MFINKAAIAFLIGMTTFESVNAACPGMLHGKNTCRRGRHLKRADVADISNKCGTTMYDVGLQALPGPHYVVTAVPSSSNSTDPTEKEDCPSIAFDSAMGEKLVYDYSTIPFEDKNFYSFGGSVQLFDILNAEEAAVAIEEGSYDIETNNCVHYGSSIWLPLGFTVTDELGMFLVTTLLNDSGFEELVIAKKKKKDFSNDVDATAWKDYVHNLVYSQLNIEE